MVVLEKGKGGNNKKMGMTCSRKWMNSRKMKECMKDQVREEDCHLRNRIGGWMEFRLD